MYSRRQYDSDKKREEFLEDNLAYLWSVHDSQVPGSNKLQSKHDINACQKELTELRQRMQQPLKDEGDNQVDELVYVQWDDELRKKYLRDFIKRHEEIGQQDGARVYVEQDLATKVPRPPSREPENDPEKIRQQDPRSLYSETIPYATLVEEIVEPRWERNWLILGEAGIGKTTFLKRIGVQFAQRALQDTTKPLPIFIRFAEYATFQQERQQDVLSAITLFSQYIARRFKDDTHIEISVDTIREGLENAEYLLLLDALDEVGRPDQRDRVLQNIKYVLNKNPVRSRTITTIRTTSYYGSTSFKPLNRSTRTLLPFSKKQCEEYIRKQLGEEAPLHAIRLSKALEDSRFQYLLSRPFLMWLMVGWLKLQPEDNSTLIPDSRLKLYDNFVTPLIEDRVEKLKDADKEEQLTAEQIRRYLRSIAHQLHTTRQQYIHEDELKECLQAVTSDITDKQIELYIVPHAGLLQKVQNSYYAFSHFIFQEYFVAEYYKEHDNEEERKRLFAYSMDAWWDEVLVIYNAFYRDNWLLQRLMAEKDTIFSTRLLLAVQCFEVLPWSTHSETDKVRDQIYERLCEKYYDCCYPLLQELLFQSIQRFDDKLFLDFLKGQLKRFESQYRRKAIEALGQLGVKSSDRASLTGIELQTLEELLMTVYNGPYRLEVIKALIPLATEKDQQTILRWLSGGEQPRPDAPKIVHELIQAERQDYIDILLDLAFDLRRPLWIRQTILTQLGRAHIHLVKQQLQEVLKSSLEEKNTVHVLELLKAIYFPVDDEMKSSVLAFLCSSYSSDVSFLKAAVFFLGNQALCAPHQSATDDSIIEQLFHLLFESNLVELTYEEQEDFYGEILSTFVKFNTPDTLDYVSNHLQTSPSDKKWDKVIATIRECGGEGGLNFLIGQLNTSLEDRMTPSGRTTEMICVLHLIVLRQEASRLSVELPLGICQKILRYLVTNSARKELVEAAVHLLLNYASYPLRTELFEIAITNQYAGIDTEIARYFLNHGKQIENEQLKNYYVRHRYRDYIYRLLIRTLPDEEWQEYLRQDLASLDTTICSITLREMYLEVAKLGFLGKDSELLENLYALLSSPHSDIVEKTMILLGELGREKEVLYKIIPFLNGPEHDLAFGVLFELAKRNFWFGEKAFLEEYYGKVN